MADNNGILGPLPASLAKVASKILGLIGLFCSVFLVSTPAHAQAEEDTVLAGWISPAGPGGVYNSAYMACEAQWEEFQGNNESSRFVGVLTRDDDFRRMDCEWTRFQYLCPEDGQQGGIGRCGTNIPSYVEITCPIDYIAVNGRLCRRAAARERPCSDECEDDGKPNPKVGNPVIVSTGAKTLESLDYASSDGLFRIGRQYRSYQVGRPIQETVLPRAPARGLQGSWNFEFNREIQLGIFAGSPSAPNATVAILLPDGTGYGFVLQPDGSWLEDSGAAFSSSSSNLTLEFIGTLPSDLATIPDTSSVWRLTDKNDAVWTLETRNGPNGGDYVHGWPTSMETRSGYTQTFSYAADDSLATLTDSFGRTATFGWSQYHISQDQIPPAGTAPIPTAVETVDLPDGTSLEYEYEDIPPPDPIVTFGGPKWAQTWRGGTGQTYLRARRQFIPKHRRLAGVERRSSTGAVLDSVQYLYENEIYGKNVTGIIDHRGERVATYVYDSAGRVVSSERADGTEAKTIAYSVNGSDRVRTVTNEYGRQSDFTFSELSSSNNEYQLTSVTSAATTSTQAASTTLTYGSDTFLTSSTDAEGRLITTTRDARGRPIDITEGSGTPEERTSTITWHANFNVPITIVNEGLTETRAYDTDGRLTSLTLTDTTSHTAPYSTNGEARTYSYSWDANGRMLSENGPLTASGSDDDLTSYTYDSGGNMLTATNALGHVTTYTGYDANGRPGSMTDPNGTVTTFAYDLLGRIETMTLKHPSNASLDAITAMTYDAVGNLTQLTLPGTAPLIMEYDTASRLTVMRGGNGERWEYTYDTRGNVERETVVRTDGSTSRLVRRQFDELGRLLRETLGTRTPSEWGYDRVSNPVSSTDPNGFTSAASFDALDRVVSTVAPDGGTIASTFDERDNALTFSDPISVTTQFVYNGFGEVIQEVSPDRGTNTYTYDAAGRMTQSTDGRGQIMDYTRDYLGRITQITPVGRPASEVIEYHWDSGGVAGSYGIGRLAKTVDGSGTTSFQYDHRGNRTIKQQTIGTSTAAQLAYEFDIADRITQITYPSGRVVRYGYDTYGRVNLVQTKETSGSPAWETVASGHQYEAFGPVESMTLGNGLAVSHEWGSDGRLAARVLSQTNGGPDLSHLAYRRDGVGRIGAIADLVNPSNSVLYGYDEVGRLTQAVSDTATTSSQTYTYNSGTNQLDTLSDGNGTRTISYDGRGNTISETRPGGLTVAATYDGHGRLETYDRSNIGAQTYTYNGLAQRVRVDKPTGTRHFVYDSFGRVIAEYGTSASDVKAEFIWAIPPAANDNSPFGGSDEIAGYAPLALVTENSSSQLELYWVHGNHLGVPVVTTNAMGSVVTPANDFLRPGFPGQSQVLSDLYYNFHRDYDPVTGRYIQADPIGLLGDVNPYLYAGADPINMIDPTGQVAFVPIIVGIGIGVGLEYLTNPCADVYDLALAGALGGLGSGASFRHLYRFGSKSLTRKTGREWSHSIPRRIVDRFAKNGSPLNKALNKRGGVNGSWVSPRRHYRHDPQRHLNKTPDLPRRLPPPLRALDRNPDWLKASVASGAGGAVVAGGSDD
ncbi:MAG: RHS repeat-associated core domain-containing protein [Erythrobacter sp.]